MAIVTTCSGCGRTLRAPESLAGKKIRCPKCNRSIRLVVHEEEAASLDAALDEELARPVGPPRGARRPSLGSRAKRRPAAAGDLPQLSDLPDLPDELPESSELPSELPELSELPAELPDVPAVADLPEDGELPDELPPIPDLPLEGGIAGAEDASSNDVSEEDAPEDEEPEDGPSPAPRPRLGGRRLLGSRRSGLRGASRPADGERLPARTAGRSSRSAAAGRELAHGVSRALAGTRPWVLLISILGFASAGLQLLCLLLLSAGIASVSRDAAAAGRGVGAAVAVFGPGAVVTGLLSWFLFAYARAIRSYVKDGRPGALEKALSAQRNFWTLAGILVVISFALFLLAILLALAAGRR